MKKRRFQKNDCGADRLYCEGVGICNVLDLPFILPICTSELYLPHGAHDVEHCRTLPDNAEYVRLYLRCVYVVSQNEEIIKIDPTGTGPYTFTETWLKFCP